MIIESPQWLGEEVSTNIHSRIGDFRVWYKAPQLDPEYSADSFFIASVLLAMRKETFLRSEQAVSSRLLMAIPQVQDILLCWNRNGWNGDYAKRHLARVKVEAASRRIDTPKASGAAAFFTAGVDSFYTALKHADEIEALIYVHGFDVMLDRHGALRTATKGIREAAAKLGKPLIEVKTNLHSVSCKFISWGPYHGAALGSVAPLLAGRFGRIYIPSSFGYWYLPPWGSHPLLDPLWSTDQVEIVHDGCEADRRAKISAIADSEVARAHLRVCLEDSDDAYNCSACEKCLRTMTFLRTIDKLDFFTSFPPLELSTMGFKYEPRVAASIWRPIWESNLRELERLDKDPDLQRAMKRVLEA